MDYTDRNCVQQSMKAILTTNKGQQGPMKNERNQNTSEQKANIRYITSTKSNTPQWDPIQPMFILDGYPQQPQCSKFSFDLFCSEVVCDAY